MRRVMTFTVECEWDQEAGVWYVADSNVPGLSGEAPTQEAMNRLLAERVPQLVQLNMPTLHEKVGREVPMELLWKERRERSRVLIDG